MRARLRVVLAVSIAVIAVAPVVRAATADDRPATELRVSLSELLGEHAFLVAETMRAASLGRGEEAALRVGLDENSANIQAAIASVYGADAGAGFGKLWQDHIDLLTDYADARRGNDAAGARAAQEGLGRYVADLSAFLASANPAFDAEAEAAALRMHVDQLTAFIDGDFPTAYASQRDAYNHMYELGDHLALGMARQFPDRFADGAVAFSPRTDLRLTLDRLLGEHLILAAETMRAGVSGAPDFGAGATALAANTDDLSAAIGSVYGAEAASGFADVWQAHIAAYVRYVEALGANDDAARDASLMQLHAYHDQIAQFLAAANPNLSAEAVAALVRRHVQALISQAEATDAGDFERAVATTREAYSGMFEVGAALADAIVRQFPDRFRDLTALPGTSIADGSSDPAVPAVVGGAILLGIAATLVAGHLQLVRRRSSPG